MASNSVYNAQQLINDALATGINKRFNTQPKKGGLLNFLTSDYAGDIGSGLLARSGYTTMPSNFGSALGQSVQEADLKQSQRNANELSELGTLATLSKTLQPTNNQPASYKEYLLTDDTPTGKEYLAFLNRNQKTDKGPASYQEYLLTTDNPSPKGFLEYLDRNVKGDDPSSYKEYLLTTDNPSSKGFLEYLDRNKTSNEPASYQEYAKTTDNPTAEGYKTFLDRNQNKKPASYLEYQLTDDTPTSEEYLSFLDRNKTDDSPSSYKEYELTTDNPTAKGYATFLDRNVKGDKPPASYQEYLLTTNKPTSEGYSAWLDRNVKADEDRTPTSYLEYSLTTDNPTADEYATWLDRNQKDKTESLPNSYKEYKLTDSTPTDKEYKEFLNKSSTSSKYTNDYKKYLETLEDPSTATGPGFKEFLDRNANKTDGDTFKRWQGFKEIAKNKFNIILNDNQAKLIDQSIGKDVSYVNDDGIVVNRFEELLASYFPDKFEGNKSTDQSTEEISSPTLASDNIKKIEFDKKVLDLSETMQSQNYTETLAVLNEVKQLTQGGNIAGFGQTGSLPDFMLTQRGVDTRSAFARLFNTTLKDRSGVAVTLPELERLKQEFNTGALKTDKDLMNALNRFERILSAEITSTLAGYPKEVIDQYKANGGLPQFNLGNKYGL